jgi:hypothetical protein
MHSQSLCKRGIPEYGVKRNGRELIRRTVADSSPAEMQHGSLHSTVVVVWACHERTVENGHDLQWLKPCVLGDLAEDDDPIRVVFSYILGTAWQGFRSCFKEAVAHVWRSQGTADCSVE